MIAVRIIRNIFKGEYENAYLEGPLYAYELKEAIKAPSARIFLNGRPLEDNTIVNNGDFIVAQIIPEGATATLAVLLTISLFAAIVGTAVSISMLTSIPSTKKLQSNPSLRGSTNSARKNQMLPILLGRYRVYPDIATMPYTVYKDNDQYLRQVFSFGYKDAVVNRSTVKIGETAITKYDGYTLDYYDISENYDQRCIESSICLKLSNDGTAEPIERTTASNTWKISVGIMAPSGISGEGNSTASVGIKIEWKSTESSSWTTAVSETISINSDKFRKMYEIIPSAAGKFDVRVTRTNKESESASVIDTVYLDVIQSWTEDTDGSKDAIIGPGRFSLLPVELKASDQLNGIIDELNAVCTLQARVYSGTGTGPSSWQKGTAVNPASAILYLLTDQYANPSPLSDDEILWDEFEEFYRFCDEHGFECNAFINSEDYSIEDICSYIAESNLAQIRKIGNRIGLIIDAAVNHITQLFTPRNAWDFSVTRSFSSEIRYFRIKYVDASLGYVETERTVSLDSEGSIVFDTAIPEDETGTEISLVGVTDPEQAAYIGRQRLREISRQKRTFRWTSDVEGILCMPGDNVLFEHDQFSIGLGEGRIKKISLDDNEDIASIELDSELLFEDGKQYGIIIRSSNAFSGSLKITPEADGKTLIFDSPVEPGLAIGDLCAVGEYTKETVTLLIQSIERDENSNCTITAVDYDPSIYEEGTIPPYDPGISEYPDSGNVGVGIQNPDVYPQGPQGEAGSFVNLSVPVDVVEYYADGIIVDDSEITITADSNGEVSIEINRSEVATGTGTCTFSFKPSDYLSGNIDVITITARSGRLSTYRTIRKQLLGGILEITADKLSVQFYADNVPHNQNENIAITVHSENYSIRPTLYIDGVLAISGTEDDISYSLPVSRLQNAMSLECKAVIGSRSESILIQKIMDKGSLTLSASKNTFEFYADNVAHNATDAITLTVGQTGYSGMPDLYIGGTKKDYSGTTYTIQASDMNASVMEVRISKGDDSRSLTISKAFDAAAIGFTLSTETAEFYYDNVAITPDISVKVSYSGLFYPPVLTAGDTEITVSDNGTATIPVSMLLNVSSLQVTLSSNRFISLVYSRTIQKITRQLVLSLGLSAAQFSAGTDGEIEPEEIVIRNNTQGLSDRNLVTLTVGSSSASFDDDGEYILTPDLITGRYIVIEISYEEEKSSAVITKTYDGKVLRLSADSLYFHLDSNGNVKPNQEITLTVHKQGIEDAVVWTDNKELDIPEGTMEYVIKSGTGGGGDEPESPKIPNLLKNNIQYIGSNFDEIGTAPITATGTADNLIIDVDFGLDLIEPITIENGSCDHPVFGTLTDIHGAVDGIYDPAISHCLSIYLLIKDTFFSNKKCYISFDASDYADDLFMLLPLYSAAPDTIAAVFSQMNKTRVSFVTTVPEFDSVFYLIYVPSVLKIQNSASTLPNDFKILNPIIVDITANQEAFTALGLTTDEEIQDYLDGIAYEDFAAPAEDPEQPQIVMLPENLLEDIEYGEPSSMPTELLVSGTPENIIIEGTSLNDAESIVLPNEDFPNLINIENGTYYGLPLNASIYFTKDDSAEPLIPLSHKLYWRIDSTSAVPTSNSFIMLHVILGGESSDLGFEPYGLGLDSFSSGFSGVTPEFDYVQGYALFYLMDNQMFETPPSFVLNHPILIDITANQDFFSSLGLSTDDEIRAYLDTINYEQFGTEITIAPTKNAVALLSSAGTTFNVDNLAFELGSNSEDGAAAIVSLDDYEMVSSNEVKLSIPSTDDISSESNTLNEFKEYGDIGEISDSALYSSLKVIGIGTAKDDETAFQYVGGITSSNEKLLRLWVSSSKIYIRFRLGDISNIEGLWFVFYGFNGTSPAVKAINAYKTNDIYSAVVDISSLGYNDSGSCIAYLFLGPEPSIDDPNQFMSFSLADFVMIPLDEYSEEFASKTDDEIREILDAAPYDPETMTVTIPSAEEPEPEEPEVNPILDGTPLVFTISAGGLSDTLVISYVSDGRDGSAAGLYIGAYTATPTAKPDGSALAEGDYYLDISDPTQPAPYRYIDGIWQLVTVDDPDWSMIASATAADVARYCTSILSVSAYYGYFQMLIANKASIEALGAGNIILRENGSIESESYSESGGLEGFRLGADGSITANSGTWRGAFANGLSFVAPTKVKITKDMTEAEAYTAMKKAGIAEGTYFQGPATKWLRKEDKARTANPPAFFAPFIDNEDSGFMSLFHLAASEVSFSSGGNSFKVLNSGALGYIIDIYPVAIDRWLFILGDKEGTALKKKGLYILIKAKLIELSEITLYSANSGEQVDTYLVKQTAIPASWMEGDYYFPRPFVDFTLYSDSVITNKTWLIGQDDAALYSLDMSSSTATQFVSEGNASITCMDGNPASSVLFSRGIWGFYSYLKPRTINGSDYIEASVIITKQDGNMYFSIARTQDMKNWISVMEIPYSAWEATGYAPLDFVDINGALLISCFSYEPQTHEMKAALASFNADGEMTILPHEEAVLPLDVEGYETIISVSGYLARRYPLIRIGDYIYGSRGGLDFFRYNTSDNTYDDLSVSLFSSFYVYSSASSSPDSFYVYPDNPVVDVLVPPILSPDNNAVYRASPDLMLQGLEQIGNSSEILILILYRSQYVIPVIYNAETGEYKIYTNCSPATDMLCETAYNAPVVSGDAMTFCVNGIMYFKGMKFDAETESIDNYSSADLPSVITEIKNNQGETITEKFESWQTNKIYFSKNHACMLEYYSLVGCYLMLGGVSNISDKIEYSLSGIEDSSISVSLFHIYDSAVVNIKETDETLEIRLLSIGYEGLNAMASYSTEICFPPTGVSSDTVHAYFINAVDKIVPFLVIHKDGTETVGTTFYWNFPAQLTTSDLEMLIRAPILKDGTINHEGEEIL